MAWYIIGRLESRKTQKTVVDAFGETRNDIVRLRNRFPQGHLRATTANNHRCILLTALRDTTSNAKQIQRKLVLTTTRWTSNQTIRNRFLACGPYARKPIICILLRARQRAARIMWAAQCQSWMQNDCSQTLFTEFRFSFESDLRLVLIWQEKGNRNNPIFI
ncbi:HTH_Tnp_Tc3_2 domain-containing protein [Trichonephila clavipes]|nr:HTH_Tnp_Tc3_2 domain-containing protein [Trichonephila clavipes]